MKWQVSGLGLVGAVGAKRGCGCPVKFTYSDGSPSVGRTLQASVTNVTAVRMFIASVSKVVFVPDVCVLEPGQAYGATVTFPWVIWFIPGNLLRISAAEAQELAAAGYGPEMQKRHRDLLRDETFAKYPELSVERPLREKVKKQRSLPVPGRRRMQAD